MPAPLKYEHVFDECERPLPHDGPCVNPNIGATWVDWDDLPHEAWHEIIPRLFIGSSTDDQPTSDEFDAVVTMWNRAPKISGIEELRFEVPDNHVPPLGDLAATVDWVLERYADGKYVLVRCQAGLNRSSLVVASTMISLGYSPTKAIDLIRQKRSKYTLCNQNFYNHLMSLEGQNV